MRSILERVGAVFTYNHKVSFHPENNATVGTIEIHISKADKDFTYKHPAALPDDVETWKDLPLAPGTMDVDPTHHIK